MPPEPRPEIMRIAPYVGGEAGIAGAAHVTKLSSNEGAFGMPPGAQAAYAQAAATLHRYPDGGAVALRRAIGAKYGLDPDRIVCDAGSDPLISLLCLIYGHPGAELIMSDHGFSMYDIAGQAAGCRVVRAPERDLTADVDAILAAVTLATRLVFLANPNNPTGTLVPHAELARLRAALPSQVLLVIDAAYAEYVTDPEYDAGRSLVEAGEDTVMLRTFSKVWGMGGLRLGWCYAPAPVVEALNRVRGPFSASSAAQAAGIAALAEPDWLERSGTHNATWRERLTTALRELGLDVWPSEANFVLTGFGTPDRAEAADRALRACGLIVRAMRGYGLPHTLRITVGTGPECEAVIEALCAFVRDERRNA